MKTKVEQRKVLNVFWFQIGSSEDSEWFPDRIVLKVVLDSANERSPISKKLLNLNVLNFIGLVPFVDR